VPLESVITTAELNRRPARARDHETEIHAVLALMDEMAGATGIAGADRVLQRLVDTALRLCRAHSAGVSLLEHDGGEALFRWRAIAGPWAKFLGGSIGRDCSPCGTVVDRNMPILMAHPERHYGFSVDAPAIEEVLLIPFHHEGRPVGTLWVIAHDDTCRFDSEDRRLMTSLSRFATTAYQLLVAQELKNELGARRVTERRLAADLEAHQRTDAAVKVTQERLEAELGDSRLLQAISAELITQDDVSALYEKILDAALSIMRSDFASMQVFVEGANGGVLKLIAHRGLDAEAAAYFDSVFPTTRSTCGQVLRVCDRVIVPDVDECEFMAGSDELTQFERAGIRAMQSTPLLSRSGRLVGVITTHWRSPHAPAGRELRLLDILSRQAADLIERRKAEETLRESDRRKDEFLATLAHELRNPLAPIRNAIQLLQLKGPPDPELTWARGVIDRQTLHLTRLVDDLLDVSRITRDRLELRTAPIELGKVNQMAVETSQPAIEQRAHTLIVSVLPESGIVDADPRRLAQVFANLLNNAAKYSEPGGTIVLSAERRDDDIVVRVRDHGIGIDEETLPRIFDLFSQLHPWLEREQGGLGIGLALVKRLVEMHNGRVTVSSEGVGRGSEFVVELPIVVPISGAPAMTDEPVSAKGSKRVLVVDDYQDGAATMCRLLGILGYETCLAEDGLAGLKAAAEFRPDVALLDIGMPKLNGYELARRLRADPWGKSMVLIAVTGWGGAHDKQRTAEAGFDHHLTKPVMPAELTRLLASAVGKDERAATLA